MDVAYDAPAAARAAELARPAPERCADEISAILEAEAIVFRPGSSVIDPVSSGVIAAIGDVLRECPGAEFDVDGHTDSSGNAGANQALSERRAEAVVAALRAEDLPLITLHARGLGAAEPRADNATAAGRASNRRIEIVLHDAEAAAREAALEAQEADDEITPLPADEAACSAEIARILSDEPIEFELGSSRISEPSADVVAEIADTLRGCGDGATFEIAGHTDDRGPAEVNQRLSEERATSVMDALVEAGIEGVEFVARGYGPDQPIADNDTVEGRARNRRIEVTLVEPQDDAAAEEVPADTSAPEDAAPEDAASEEAATEIPDEAGDGDGAEDADGSQ